MSLRLLFGGPPITGYIGIVEKQLETSIIGFRV